MTSFHLSLLPSTPATLDTSCSAWAAAPPAQSPLRTEAVTSPGLASSSLT